MENTAQTSGQSGYAVALGLVWEMGYLIAIPAFLFGFGGAYLDRYMGTSPLFILLGLLIALVLSSIGVVRAVRRALPPETPKK